MPGQILTTDDGPHPAGKWAEVSARQIADLIEVLPTADKKYSTSKRKAEIALIDVLEGHHAAAQDAERSALTADAAARLSAPLDPSQHLAQAVADVVAAFAGTEFEAHFSKPEVQAVVAETLARNLASTQHVERLWHLDRNPGLVAA